MRLTYPGIVFVTSQKPMSMRVDGTSVSIGATEDRIADPSRILMMPEAAARQIFRQRGHEAVTVHPSLDIPDTYPVPDAFDGTYPRQGTKVLVMMFTGWGDTILVQPVIRYLYEQGTARGTPPTITLAADWIHNFPYAHSPFIARIRPNVLTLADFLGYEVFVNLTHLTRDQFQGYSLKHLFLREMGYGEHCQVHRPSIEASPERVRKIAAVFDDLRRRTGRKILSLNWRARFPHKHAPPRLFCDISEALSDTYQSILITDKSNASIMARDIEEHGASISNCSSLITDFHDTIAALSLCDGIISVDTGVVHAAGALGIPGAALFGPFHAASHIGDYPSLTGIQSSYRSETCPGPCEESHRGCKEVNFDPRRVSPCFKAIRYEDVVDAFRASVKRGAAA